MAGVEPVEDVGDVLVGVDELVLDVEEVVEDVEEVVVLWVAVVVVVHVCASWLRVRAPSPRFWISVVVTPLRPAMALSREVRAFVA